MPSLFKKRRPSSASTVSEDLVASPSRNDTSLPPKSSKHGSKPSTPARKQQSTDQQTDSPSKTKFSLSPMGSVKSTIAKKFKRQIQRIDEALHHVTVFPRHSPKGVTAGTQSAGKAKKDRTSDRRRTKSELVITPSSFAPIFPSVAVVHKFPSTPSSSRSSQNSNSTRKRTLSTPKDEDRYYDRLYKEIEDRAFRNRTASCPTVFDPSAFETKKKSMTSMRAESVGSSSLLPVEEENLRSVEGQAPSSPYTEPDVPDPFLVDEEGDAFSEEEKGDKESSVPVLSRDQTLSPAVPPHDIPLSVPPSPSPQPTKVPLSPRLPLSANPLMSPNVNKDVPPPPVSESDEDDDVPELYLPNLVIPTMFLPIPNTDPLTILINKYIYPPEKRPVRDVSGEWQHSDFHTLVMTNSWRALARMARDRIVSSDPTDLNLILGLWHLRLSCLARLRLFNQTAAECTNLFGVLNSIDPPEARAYLFDRLLPFELEVMYTRLKYWAGDHMGYLDALSGLLNKCKAKAKAASKSRDATTQAMWKERGARVVLIMASQLVEMKEHTAAARLLEPLSSQPDGVTSPALESAIARIYLQCGNLAMATHHINKVAADPTTDERQKRLNQALLASAEGDWDAASTVLREMIEKDAEDYVAVNNLSVALLSQGKLKEGTEVLESALKASPSSVVVAEPFLFNLSTLYELRSSLGFERKRDLLVEVAKWSGDGLKTACLKLPSN